MKTTMIWSSARLLGWTLLFAAWTAAYAQNASQVRAPRPLLTASGQGVIMGYVYWDGTAIRHTPPGSCSGLSMTVSTGSATLGTFSTNHFTYVANVGTLGVCAYAVNQMPVGQNLQVLVSVTSAAAFSPAALPSGGTASVSIMGGNALCNNLPPAVPSPTDLSRNWWTCPNYVYNLNFILVSSRGLLSSRVAGPVRVAPGTAVELSPQPYPPKTAPSSGAAQTLNGDGRIANAPAGALLQNRQPQGMLSPGQTMSATTSSGNPKVATSAHAVAPPPAADNVRSNPGSGDSGPTSLQPLIPRSSSNTGSASGSEKPLTNADILKLLRAGISEENILTVIRTHPATFDVSDQARASFDKECAAIKPAKVTTGVWATETRDVWDAMNNVVICQETNGRGGEGACDLSPLKSSPKSPSKTPPPVPSKGQGKTEYEPMTVERGVTKDTGFANWANSDQAPGKGLPSTSESKSAINVGGTGGTNGGVNNGNKNSDELSPQPYPPKNTPAAPGSPSSLALVAAPGCGLCGDLQGSTNLQLEPGKYVVTITYTVQEQRQNEPRTATRCITRGDLDDPEKIFNDQTSPTGNEEPCSVRNLKSANRRLVYDADCSNRTVHVEGSLNGEGFSVVRTVRPKGNQAVSLKFTLRGTRTSDCDQKMQ